MFRHPLYRPRDGSLVFPVLDDNGEVEEIGLFGVHDKYGVALSLYKPFLDDLTLTTNASSGASLIKGRTQTFGSKLAHYFLLPFDF